MNRLRLLFASILLLFSAVAFSQAGYLFIKKGIRKKRTYTEGDPIHIRLEGGFEIAGTITLLRNDTVFINGVPVNKELIKEVLLKRSPKTPFPDAKTLLLIGAGSALTSAGLAISKQASTKDALIAGPVIGFGPLLVKHFGGRGIRAMKRKKFRIGRKFRLQVLDFYLPQRQLKTF